MSAERIFMGALVALSLLASAAQAETHSAFCRELKIFTENQSDEFVKITPDEKGETAKFEICDYARPENCRSLGKAPSYDIRYLGGKKYMEYIKGGTLLVIEGELVVLTGAAAGFIPMIGLGGAAVGSTALEIYAALGMSGTYLTGAALAGGATALLLSTSDFFNPMNRFRDSAAIRDIREALHRGSCAVSFELDKNELRHRIESLLESLDQAELARQ